MKVKLKVLLGTIGAAQEQAKDNDLAGLAVLNDARMYLEKAAFIVGNFERSMASISEQQPQEAEQQDETTRKIRAAEKHIIVMPDGTKKIGNKVFRGDVPQRPLIEFYDKHISVNLVDEKIVVNRVPELEKVVIPIVADEKKVDVVVGNDEPKDKSDKVPTTDILNPISVTSEADYLEKKDLLANASEAFRQSEAYAQIAIAVTAYEEVTGADKPKEQSRREVMEILLPALVITDAKIVEINEYAKNVSIDSIKKKYTKDEINAVNIVLHGIDVVDSALGAARTLHNIHHPEKA